MAFAGSASDNSNTASTPEVVHVRTHRVSCEGSGGALGHPKVFYDIPAGGQVTVRVLPLGDFVLAEVADTGIGISQKDMHQ